MNLVKRIFSMFVMSDYSMNQIALYLDSFKALNVRWDDKKIKAILVNSIYKGLYEAEGIYIENHSPAIIEEWLFDKAQQKLKQKQHDNKIDYIFKGIKCVCEDCKTPLFFEPTIKPNKIYRYIVCRKCNIRINEEKVFRLIANSVRNFVRDKYVIDESKKKSRRFVGKIYR